jgi:hypothetical protein
MAQQPSSRIVSLVGNPSGLTYRFTEVQPISNRTAPAEDALTYPKYSSIQTINSPSPAWPLSY